MPPFLNGPQTEKHPEPFSVREGGSGQRSTLAEAKREVSRRVLGDQEEAEEERRMARLVKRGAEQMERRTRSLYLQAGQSKQR